MPCRARTGAKLAEVATTTECPSPLSFRATGISWVAWLNAG